MKLSNEMKEYLLGKLKELSGNINRLIKKIENMENIKTKYVSIPIILDGVVDELRYNIAEKRFDYLICSFAKSGITESGILYDHTALCDETQIVSIPIPKNFFEND